MANQIPLFFILLLASISMLIGQTASIRGKVQSLDGESLAYANIVLTNQQRGVTADEKGDFHLTGIEAGEYRLVASYLGFEPYQKRVEVEAGKDIELNFSLVEADGALDEVVITGTLKEVQRLESPVPVEVYSPAFFQKNPTPNIYEALQNVNGVRPQLNCQVCNTGDIHINGLEGPYTMVLIDGMPIVSSLATVYGLSGIPNSLVQRMEVVKGPASSLYGSEAIGGLINIITKDPSQAPVLTADVMATTWQEYNVDLGLRLNLGEKVSVLTGVNYYNFDKVVDKNADNFTDLTLQERVSVFQKWNVSRANNRLFTLAGRYYREDRWGGELNWTQADRGGNEVYGEAITTQRWEFIGKYQLPTSEHLMLSFSLNGHQQNSVYGDLPYIAEQNIGFGQLTWDRKIKNHDLLAGAALRYTYYDDNTPATGGEVSNPQNTPNEAWLPGVFVQDEVKLTAKQTMLLGLRYDYHNVHSDIWTPRLAYKWSISEVDIFRINAGTGFRVVNLFTEDHAALTGAREVIIQDELAPEQSYNVNANFVHKWYMENGGGLHLELSGFYTYFTNVILPDYETNANQIIYDNLDGSADTKGLSLNADLSLPNGLSVILGATLMDVSTVEDGIRSRQLLTERFTSTWAVSYRFWDNKMTVDYTGSLYSPMLLPTLGELDPRPAESPWWTIQNMQVTYRGLRNFEFYGGVKNLLNWTPWKNLDHPIIARSFDPFDRGVVFDGDGQVVATPENPYALTFDPSYVYAPNQGIRGFLGIRYSLPQK